MAKETLRTTREFCNVVKIQNRLVIDKYLRPVNYVLSSPTHNALVIMSWNLTNELLAGHSVHVRLLISPPLGCKCSLL
jgi:hypothetical protein